MSQPASPYDSPRVDPPRDYVPTFAAVGPSRPRAWTPFAVVVLAILANAFVSFAAIFTGMFVTLGPSGVRDLIVQVREQEETDEPVGAEIVEAVPIVDVKPPGATDDILADEATDGEGDDEEPSPWEAWMLAFVKTPLGFATIVVPGQLAFLGVAAFCAMLSPVPFRERLGLLPSREPWPAWIAFALASPAVTFLANIPMSLVVDYENSESLALFEEIFTAGGPGFFLITLVGIGILPAVAEEFLFRGYVQSRFAKLWPAWLAIFVSAALFALAHLDPIHSLGVLPLGIWIGIVFHRTRSLYPAMACHFVNNAFAVIASRLSIAFVDLDETKIDPTRWELWVMAALMMGTMFFLLLSAAYLLTTGFSKELTSIEPSPSSAFVPTPEFAAATGRPIESPGIEFVSDPGAARASDSPEGGIRFLPPRDPPDAGDDPRSPPS